MILPLLLGLTPILGSTPLHEEGLAPPIQPIAGLRPTLRAARDSGRQAVVVFGAVWCASCRKFRSRTLTDAAVRRAGAQFEWGYVDIDRASTLAREHDVRGTPNLIVMNGDGTELARLVGDPGPEGLVAFLGSVRTGDPVTLPELDLTNLIWSPEGYRGEAICFSHVGYGPLRVSSQSAGNVLRLALEPRTPSTLLKGQAEVRWTETLTNYWAFEENEYRLDFGALQSQVALGYGVTDTVQVELALIDYRRFDSVLDDITNAFHSAFGLDDSGRDDFPDHENVISIDSAGVQSIDEDRYSDDFALTLQHNLTCGTETLPAISWAVTARTNLGGNIELDGDDDLSLGLSVALSRRMGSDWYAYGSLGYAWHGLDRWRGIELQDTQLSGLLAFEYRYAPRASWIFQFLYTEEVAARVAPFDDASFEFDIGWKKEITEGTVLELGLLENAFTVDNSPDVGFHFGLTHRF